MNLPPLILASTSPRRAELLRQIGFKFQIAPGETPEVHDEQLTAWEMAQINAYRKARLVAKRFPDALVLGADTLVYLDQETKLYGKPADHDDAVRMLLELQGRTHAVITGVCLLHLREHQQRIFAGWTDVTFHPLNADQIRAYLALVDPLDKAGSYAIQEHGERIISEISGSYSNVVGLPLELLQREIQTWAAK